MTFENVHHDSLADAAAAGSGFGSLGENFKMPSMEDVLKLIDQMDGISEEERENIRSNIRMQHDSQTAQLLQMQLQGHSTSEYAIFLAMLVLIALVFAIFGYKLYKSLMAKEQKKQEKLKHKQSKRQKQK